MSDFEIVNGSTRSAPEGVEEGLVPAKFLGIAKINHPDWATEKGKYGPDNGDRFHWTFVLTDSDGDELYEDGDPIEVEGVNGTNFNTKSDKSKNAAWLKAVSPKAWATLDAEGRIDPDDIKEGAPCMLLLTIKDNGWPKIENVLPAPTKRAKRAKVEVSDDDEE